jgi:hypothetical protein
MTAGRTAPTPGREPQFAVPLVWRDDRTGYQCPCCSLYVAVPKASWATCPRCPGIPIDEVADLLLQELTALDESDRGDVLDVLRPLLEGLVKR